MKKRDKYFIMKGKSATLILTCGRGTGAVRGREGGTLGMDSISRRRNGSIRWYLLGTLVAVELLMSFSFLGYVHVEPLSITTAYIPVLLAGALMGPLEAMILGAVFGLASMWKASASYVMAFDQLFSPMMSGRPLESILLSVGARALFGLLAGLLYVAARRARHPGFWVGVVSYFGRSLHALLVYSALWVFFPEAGYTPASALEDMWSLNDVASNVFPVALVLLVRHILNSATWRQFQARVEAARGFHLGERYHVISLVGIILLTLVSSVAVAIYFVHRMETVLDQQGVVLPETGYADLFHLQIQFLIGILAMMALVIVFLVFNRRYSTYMGREARTDALTGVLNRKAFFQSCGRALGGLYADDSASGYFIMVDLDWFKEINDHYGHPEGDRALKEAAMELRTVFGEMGFIGRVGGDEFAVLLCVPVSHEELEETLLRFRDRVHRIQWEERRMSCSIGAQPITADKTAAELYREADRLLYLAKKTGKDRYVIGPVGEKAGVKAAG